VRDEGCRYWGLVTQEWATEIKADGYGNSAIQAAEITKNLLGKI